MNLSYSLPYRVNGFPSRLLISLVLLSFVLFAFNQFAAARNIMSAASSPGHPTLVNTHPAPQAVAVPTPSTADYAQPPAPQLSATPAPAGYRLLPQPVATPPAGR